MIPFSRLRPISSLVAAAVFSFVAFYAIIVFWPQNRSDGAVRIEVAPGNSMEDAAEALEKEGILREARSFLIAARLMGHGRDLPPGRYYVTGGSNHAILRQMIDEGPRMVRVTVREGCRMEEIAEILEEQLGIERGAFLDLVRAPGFAEELEVDAPSLEGYLFPSTYRFHEGESPEVVGRMMVAECRRQMDGEITRVAAERGMSEMEVLTLASIIEGEAAVDSERAVISAVYHNRLRAGMRLQADPTVQYIIPGGPRRLLYRDLAIASPYNTYLHDGLPPGPINSPGRKSIEAAVAPAPTDVLYFVARGDGSHTFSRTQEEHLEAKRAFQKIRREARQYGEVAL